MLNTFKDIMRLVRWSNLLFLAALIYLMEKWVAVPILDAAAFGEQLPWFITLLLALATVLIAAGGYVINDYFDVKIDRINRPDELIVTRTIPKPTAMHLSLCLSGVGILCGLVVAIVLRSMTLGILFVIVPGLLWFYSSSYKRLFMVGNLIIALLAGLTPMLVAMTNVAQLQLRFAPILPYTCDQWTKIFVTALAVLTIAIIGHLWYRVLPFPIGWNSLSTRYIVLGIITPLLGALWLLWAAKIPSDYKNCQQLIKFTMFLGMLYSICLRAL